MAKILNLDSLSQSSGRFLTMKGQKYPVVPMSVEGFIETTQTVEAMVKDGASMAEQIKATVDLICRCVPSAPRAELVGYDLTMLNTIATFVRGEDVEQQQEEAAEEVAGK